MYKAFLVLHIIGITIMAGTTFIDYLIYKQFWRSYLSDHTQGLIFERMANTLQRLVGIGMLLIILSGVGMMYYMHEVWGQQIWFRIKMGLLFIIILNGLGLRRRTGTKVQRFLTSAISPDISQLSSLRFSMTLIQLTQMMLFTIIFTLSVFKFN
ncbi:MAG: hypothetical protein ABIS36_11050 [Chryseolinea sp.]